MSVGRKTAIRDSGDIVASFLKSARRDGLSGDIPRTFRGLSVECHHRCVSRPHSPLQISLGELYCETSIGLQSEAKCSMPCQT